MKAQWQCYMTCRFVVVSFRLTCCHGRAWLNGIGSTPLKGVDLESLKASPLGGLKPKAAKKAAPSDDIKALIAAQKKAASCCNTAGLIVGVSFRGIATFAQPFVGVHRFCVRC